MEINIALKKREKKRDETNHIRYRRAKSKPTKLRMAENEQEK